MNIKHLEMMRVMLNRVHVGSWKPTVVLDDGELWSNGYKSDAVVKLNDFDLAHWVLLDTFTQQKTGVTCGFSACAIGHACFDEEFRKLGWEWSDIGTPKFEGKSAWGAVQKFFDIVEGTDDILFQDTSYQGVNHVTAKMVAIRIEELMTMGETKFRKKYADVLGD